METFNRQGEPILFSVYMAKDVVRKIWMEIDSEKKSDLLLNGLIYDFRAKGQGSEERLELLSVAAGFMPDDIELLKTLTCLCAAREISL